MAGRYTVTVTRVGEGPNDKPDFTVEADTITVAEDGRLVLKWEGGGEDLSSSSWGWFEVTRVPSARRRGV